MSKIKSYEFSLALIMAFIVSSEVFSQEKKTIYDWTGNDWNYNYTKTSGEGRLAAMMLVGELFIPHAKDINICPPKGSNVGQATAVVEKYMKEHPEYWHLNAGSLIAAALRQTFPCPSN
jgi:hypothetical protein